MDEVFSTGDYAMVAARPENDSGVGNWFGGKQNDIFGNEVFVMPVGKATNLHCQIFSTDLYVTYQGLMPDIFASHCTESVFSFMCAALKQSWAIAGNIEVSHAVSLDGASWGFNPGGVVSQQLGMETWEHLVEWAPHRMRDMLENFDVWKSGMGYEEFRHIKLHDASKYDENGHCTDERLKDDIRTYFFLDTPSDRDWETSKFSSMSLIL